MLETITFIAACFVAVCFLGFITYTLGYVRGHRESAHELAKIMKAHGDDVVLRILRTYDK